MKTISYTGIEWILVIKIIGAVGGIGAILFLQSKMFVKSNFGYFEV